jgi:hypothetical protein
LFFIKDGDWKAKPESGSTKNIFTLFLCYRESFDKENQEEEGRTGPRLYTTTFLPRIRSRSNKVPYPTPVLWIRIKHFGKVGCGSGSDLLDQNLHIFFGPIRL